MKVLNVPMFYVYGTSRVTSNKCREVAISMVKNTQNYDGMWHILQTVQ